MNGIGSGWRVPSDIRIVDRLKPSDITSFNLSVLVISTQEMVCKPRYGRTFDQPTPERAGWHRFVLDDLVNH